MADLAINSAKRFRGRESEEMTSLIPVKFDWKKDKNIDQQ